MLHSLKMSVSRSRGKSSLFISLRLKKCFVEYNIQQCEILCSSPATVQVITFQWVSMRAFYKGKGCCGRRERRGLNLLNSAGDQHGIYRVSCSPPCILRWFCFDFGSDRKSMQFLFNLKEVLFEQSSNCSPIQVKCTLRTIYFSMHGTS